jgi:hypothetical protein
MRDSHVNGLAKQAGHLPQRAFFWLATGIFLCALGGCKSESSGKADFVYVAVPEAALRDHVATIYSKTGVVHNGERLMVLERMQNRRFVRVRSPRGEEGWLQERYLADQQTFDQFRLMAEQYKDTPVQATATVEHEARVHVVPGRKAASLFPLAQKEKVGLLKRQTINRNAVPGAPKEPDAEPDTTADDPASGAEPAVWEDWWLVRDSQQRAGWVLGRSLFVDVPDEIGTYAEGQRMIAAFPLDEMDDDGKKVSDYLVAYSEPKDGLPYDYDQVRVFTWNKRKHRYEGAYRERHLAGTLPVSIGRQEFEKEGTLRTFTLRSKDEGGQVREQIYKFNPPIVRKVVAPGQKPAAPARKPAHPRG